MNPTKPLLSVYVRAGSATKKIKIKNGSYIIYYSTGTEFESVSRKFLTDPVYNKFDDTMVCQGSRRAWTDYTLSIYVSNGNASVTPVDEDDYPK